MWLMRTLLPAVVVIILLGFAFLNPNETVDIDLFFRQYYEVQLTVVVLLSVILGMALMLSLSIYHDIRIRAQMKRLRAEKMKLEEELITLRTTPLEGLDSASGENR
ncbi:MAG: LapA family protein [Candidatus Glassbacteria bacterium]